MRTSAEAMDKIAEIVGSSGLPEEDKASLLLMCGKFSSKGLNELLELITEDPKLIPVLGELHKLKRSLRLQDQKAWSEILDKEEKLLTQISSRT